MSGELLEDEERHTSCLWKGGKVVDSLPEMFRYAKGHGEDDEEMYAACTVGDGGCGER